MSSNFTFQAQSIPQSPTSSSTSSIDDEINNSAARVYFGPIQSPEKILIAKVAHRRNNLSSLPVRRSPRLSAVRSSPQTVISLEEGEKAAGVISGEQRMGVMDRDAPVSTTVTSDEDCLQDDIELEPPSALATKIARAHDNPSPPPTMQPLESGCDDPALPTSTERHSHFNALKGSSSTVAVGSPPREQTRSPSESHECFTSIDPRPTVSPSANVSADLIVFDDSNFPNVPDVPSAAPVVQRFPDLLAPTPIRKAAVFSGGSESTFQSILPDTQVGSPGKQNEATEQHVISPPDVAVTPQRPPFVLQSQNVPTPLNEVDPSDNLLQPDTCNAGTSIPTVEVEPSRLSSQVRELGSLSPVSEGVLHNLLSTSEAVTDAPLNQISSLASVFPSNQPPRDRPSIPGRESSPEQRISPVAIHSVQRPSPVRSPWRTHIANSGSPNKFAFNTTPRDPSLTPARRIPIDEAIAQGSASPRRDNSSGPSTGIFGLPVFTRYTPAGGARSPVRPSTSDAMSYAAMPLSGISRPTALTSAQKVRSGSEEPQSGRKSHLARSFLRSASDSEISSPPKPRRIPTFSVHPGGDPRLPCTIPEEEQGSDSPMKPAQLLKSELRQPSSMAGSRIPRIGAKPYSRPLGKEKQQGKGKDPVHKLLFMTRRSTSASVPTKPVRLVKGVNTMGGASSSEGVVDSNMDLAAAPSQTNTSALPQPSPSLKRKRPLEEITSPPANQPTFARLVTSVSKSQKPSSIPPPAPPSLGEIVKKARIGHVRRVGGDNATQKRVSHSQGVPTSAPEPAKSREQPTCLGSPPPQSHIRLPAPALTPLTAADQPTSPRLQSKPASPPTVPSTTSSPEPDERASNSHTESLLSNPTRVTRSRRTPQPKVDVFGAVRPLQQRRRRPTVTPAESTFSSMSATALKALTTSNTTKNQHNLVAVLETEVVRKPGKRPGSPTTSVQTIEEKRRLEQGKGRKERAERRARRSSEPLEDSSLISDDEESLPLGPGGQPLRHRRGPGDEEDYETPERIERPEKRMRIHEAGGRGEEVETKTVRWDRGLYTTIYFDDLPLQSQTRDAQQTPATGTRGVLAGSAKALQLDSLGNLVNATSPLKELVQENVVIKKFVYDDDAEAAEFDALKPQAKGKGKKSQG